MARSRRAPKGQLRRNILERLKSGPASERDLFQSGPRTSVLFNLRKLMAQGVVTTSVSDNEPESVMYRLSGTAPEDIEEYALDVLGRLEAGRGDVVRLAEEVADLVIQQGVGGELFLKRVAAVWPSAPDQAWEYLSRSIRVLAKRAIQQDDDSRKEALRAIAPRAESLAMSKGATRDKREASFELLWMLGSPKAEALAWKLLMSEDEQFDSLHNPRAILRSATEARPLQMRRKLLDILDSPSERVRQRALALLDATRAIVGTRARVA